MGDSSSHTRIFANNDVWSLCVRKAQAELAPRAALRLAVSQLLVRSSTTIYVNLSRVNYLLVYAALVFFMHSFRYVTPWYCAQQVVGCA